MSIFNSTLKSIFNSTLKSTFEGLNSNEKFAYATFVATWYSLILVFLIYLFILLGSNRFDNVPNPGPFKWAIAIAIALLQVTIYKTVYLPIYTVVTTSVLVPMKVHILTICLLLVSYGLCVRLCVRLCTSILTPYLVTQQVRVYTSTVPIRRATQTYVERYVEVPQKIPLYA